MRDKIKRIIGYRVKGYDAMYEKATFEISKRYSDENEIILEVTDLNASVTFIVPIPSEFLTSKQKK